MAREYEITGYIMTPVSISVEADTVLEALEAGVAMLEDGEGWQGEELFSHDFSAWDVAGHMSYPMATMAHGEITHNA